MDREELRQDLSKLSNGLAPDKHFCFTEENIINFILEDRRRIIRPIEEFRKSTLKMFGSMGWDGKDLPYKAIDQTLKLAGLNE